MKTLEFQKILKPGDILSIKERWINSNGWKDENNNWVKIKDLNINDYFQFIGYRKCYRNGYLPILCRKCKGRYVVEYMKSKKQYYICGNFGDGYPMFKIVEFEEFITESEFSI